MLSWGWFTEEPKGLLTCLEMTETGENEKVEEVRWFDPLCFQRFRESVLCQWSKLVSGWNWACGQAGDHCSLGKAGSQSHKGPRVKILSLAKFYSNASELFFFFFSTCALALGLPCSFLICTLLSHFSQNSQSIILITFSVESDFSSSTTFPRYVWYPWPSFSNNLYCCFSVAQLCLTPWTCSNSCPSNRWCHLTIASSVIPSSCCQSFPASGSFIMSWLFASGGQSIGASASASVLPVNIQGWFPLAFTGLISLQSLGLSRVFSNTTVQKNQFFDAQPSLIQLSHPYMTTGNTIASTTWTFVGKEMSLLFNMLFRFVIAFLPRNNKVILLRIPNYPWYFLLVIFHPLTPMLLLLSYKHSLFLIVFGIEPSLSPPQCSGPFNYHDDPS